MGLGVEWPCNTRVTRAGWEGPGKQEAELELCVLQTAEEEHICVPECVCARTDSFM